MLVSQEIVKFLRVSLRLEDPSTEVDPAYIFEDPDLWEICEYVVPVHNINYTIETFPEKEKYFIILLAKKEIYYRLATSSAPFYPISAEGAELRKDYRFEHYMSLIRRVEIDYATAMTQLASNTVIEVKDLLLLTKHYHWRNYNLASAPTVEVTLNGVQETSVDITWDKFEVQSGIFSYYEVYISEQPIYDFYEDSLSKTATRYKEERDIHKTRCRVSGLTPGKAYYVLVTSKDTNGLTGYSEATFNTPAQVIA